MNELRIAIILITIAVLFAIPTPCRAQQTVQVVRACNLRSGPGTSYARVGGVRKGDVLGVWASQPEWYQVGQGVWIAVFCTGAYSAEPEHGGL